MTTDNRTNGPTEAQVEAAAREWYEQANGYETWASASGKHQHVVKARAAKALEAATRVPVHGDAREQIVEYLRTQNVFTGETGTKVAEEQALEIFAIIAAFPALDGAPETDGKRWFAACWRDDNGTLNSLESSTIVREYAEADVKRWRDQEQREPNGQPDRVVLATKISYPWLPVEGEKP